MKTVIIFFIFCLSLSQAASQVKPAQLGTEKIIECLLSYSLTITDDVLELIQAIHEKEYDLVIDLVSKVFFDGKQCYLKCFKNSIIIRRNSQSLEQQVFLRENILSRRRSLVTLKNVKK